MKKFLTFICLFCFFMQSAHALFPFSRDQAKEESSTNKGRYSQFVESNQGKVLTPTNKIGDLQEKLHRETKNKWVVYSFGGGALLAKVFQATGALAVSKRNSLFEVVGFWCFVFAVLSLFISLFKRLSWQEVAKKLIIPYVFFGALFCTTKEVAIIDVASYKTGIGQQAVYTASPPLALGFVASFLSQFGYHLQRIFESVFHTVSDHRYSWTGAVFGSDNLFNAAHYRIQDPILKKNVEEFFNQCVFWDTSEELYARLDGNEPLYTEAELKSAGNMLDFLRKRTSRRRFMSWTPMDGDQFPTKTGFLTCKQAIENIHVKMNHEKARPIFKKEYIGNLEGTYGFLIEKSEAASRRHDDLIVQQLLTNAFLSSWPGVPTAEAHPTIAAQRAKMQEMEQKKILGWIGREEIIGLKNVLEALLYSCVIFIIPFFFFGNYKVIKGWLSGLIAVQIWPALFVILDFILNVSWGMFNSYNDMNVLSSIGISDLYERTATTAAFLMSLVAYLSWYIVNGQFSFSGLSQALSGPAQGAAAKAATEQVDGTESVGAITRRTFSIGNQSAFKNTTSPTIEANFATYSDGKQSEILNFDGIGNTIQTRQAAGAVSMNLFDSAQATVGRTRNILDEWASTIQSAESLTRTETAGYEATVAKQFATSHKRDLQFTTSDQWQQLEFVQQMWQQASDIAQRGGFETSNVMKAALSGNFGLLSGAGETVMSTRRGIDEVKHWTASDQFQEQQQALHSLMQSEAFARSELGSSTDAENYKNGFSKLESFSSQRSQLESQRASITKLQSEMQSAGFETRENLSTRFGQSLREWGYGNDEIGQIFNGTHPKTADLINKFSQEYVKEKTGVFLQKIGYDSNHFTYQRDEQLKKLNTELDNVNIASKLSNEEVDERLNFKKNIAENLAHLTSEVDKGLKSYDPQVGKQEIEKQAIEKVGFKDGSFIGQQYQDATKKLKGGMPGHVVDKIVEVGKGKRHFASLADAQELYPGYKYNIKKGEFEPKNREE